MSWKIYLIKHLDTDMKYVGITGGDLATRWEQHRADTNSAVYKALRTEGYRMTMELLEEVATKPEALKKEQEYIRSLGTATPDGWNRKVSTPKDEPVPTPKKWLRCQNQIGNRDWVDGVLQCRVCKGDYTHQETVEVFIRDDDSHSAPGTKITVQHDITTVREDDMKTNPSYRRGGIRIYFTCEGCGNTLQGDDLPPYELLIYQHKGRTFFETVYYIEDNS
jgi:predicted GIY-YIG superfamily endonuclease